MKKTKAFVTTMVLKKNCHSERSEEPPCNITGVCIGRFLTSFGMTLFLNMLLFSLLGGIKPGFCQVGGNNTYEFLNLVSSAKVAALGGEVISIKDDDLNLAWHNPSLLNSAMHNHLSLSFVDYFSDINYGSVIYSRTYEKYGSFSGGMQYLHYGTFKETDETGNILGEFTADDYTLNLGWGREIDSMFSIGANLKMIYSSYYLYEYNSFGAALDLAGTYHNAKRQITVAAVIKNAGVQIKAYRKKNREALPFEIQLGLSKKLKHAPFRLSIIARHLQKWDLTYKDPNDPSLTFDSITGEEINQKKNIGGKIMRHFVFGGEFLLTKNFNIRFGYNYQRRKELQVATRRALTGFSWGVGLKVSKFHISYGRASYHLAGGTNHFTITTNLSEFYSKTDAKNHDRH